MKLVRILVAALIAQFLYCSVTYACLYQDPRADEPSRKLVDRAEKIFVGDVVSLKVSSNSREYTIRVVEALKGKLGGIIKLKWPSSIPASLLQTEFSLPLESSVDHNSALFWLGREAAGRASVTSCVVSFYPRRGKHLIFITPEVNHFAGFEPIGDHTDSWYKLVKAQVENPNLTGLELTPSEFVAMFSSVGLWECGEDAPRLVKRIRGRVDDLQKNEIEFYGAPYEPEGRDRCTDPKQRFITLHASRSDKQPIGVPVFSSGKLEFGQRYGLIYLLQRSMPLNAVH